MRGVLMDFVVGLKYSFDALKEKKLYVNYLALIAVVAIFVMASAASSFFAMALFIPYILALWYFTGKFMHYKLAAEKLTSAPYSLDLFLKFASAAIVQILHVLFFWRTKKWLLLYLIPIVGILLALGLFAANVSAALNSNSVQAIISALLYAAPGLVVFLLGLIIILIAYMFHNYRLIFLPQIKLCSPNADLGLCSQQSWAMTNKKVLALLLYNIAFGICISIPLFTVLIAFALAFKNFMLIQLVQSIAGALTYPLSAFFGVYLFKSIKLEAAIPAKRKPK